MYFPPYPYYGQPQSTILPEIPMNPPLRPHHPPPVTYPRPEFYGPAKRRRDEYENAASGGEAEGSAAKRARAQDVVFRIVVASRQIGKVIGKEGCRIQKIREETKANIKIADAIARHEERVIIISSKENDGITSDAENALKKIATLIIMEDDSLAKGSKVAGGQHVPANTIRLLIAGSQVGSLIGLSGQNIEKLRNSSGASITVLAPNQLPLCASAQESDRVVLISGDVPVVMKALEEIGCQLRINPPKQVISISPTYNYGSIRPSQLYVDPTSADYVTMEMMVSETLIGGLIGRYGSNIQRIRNESGATIKVHGGKGERRHRSIQFGGTTQQVALAKQRVDECIYSQLVQGSGGGQPQQSLLQR